MWLRRPLRRQIRGKKAATRRSRKIFLEPLEPRLLLSGDATLHVELVTEVESNNTLPAATLLPLVEEPAGSGLFLGRGLGAQDPARLNETWSDPDYWQIEALAGDIVSVSVDTPESAVNPYVELRNAADGVLRADFDSGPDVDAFLSHYLIPSSGSYYIRIGKYDSSTVAGSYQLRVDLARGIQLESDGNYSNDSIGGANQLGLIGADGHSRATVAGTVMAPEGNNGDEDLFGWGTSSAGNLVELSVANPSGSTLIPRVSLVNSSGVALPDADGNVNDGHVLVTLPADGAYYARVEAASGAGPWAQYLLDVDISDLTPPWMLSVSGLPPGGEASDDPIASFAVTVSEELNPATVGLGLRQVWTYGGHFYLLTDSAMTWATAEGQAQALGGHLVTVNDAAEQQWLWKTFGGFGNLWIGFSDQAVEGTWAWADGGAVTYTNWQTGQPAHYNDAFDYANMEGVTGQWRNTEISSFRGLVELLGPDGDTDGLPDRLDPYPSDPLNAWDLRSAGADGVFDTADDVIYRLTLAASYSGGTKVQLFIEEGPLPSGSYRLTGNCTLRDRSGNPLDGNGDGIGGDPYQQFFRVGVPAGMVLEGGNNNTLPAATLLPLVEEPAGSGLFLGRGLGAQDPARLNETWSDPDYWRFEARAGDIVSVSVDTPESAVDPYLELRNAADVTLRADFDSGPGVDAFLSHYVIPSSGTYYIRVGKYDASTTAGSYQLRVDLARGVQLETDGNYSNDSIGGANAVSFQAIGTQRTATIAGTIMAAGDNNVDEDYYRLGVVQAGETIFLSLRLAESSSLVPAIQVRKSNGELVAIAPNPSDAVARVDVTSADTYYAVVLATAGEGPHGQYLLDAAIWPSGELECADLSLTGMSAPADASSGEEIHIAWTVGNFGTGVTDAMEWYDRMVLSGNDRYGDDDDINLTSVEHEGTLGPGDQYTAEADVRLPLGISGDYWLFVETDQNNAVFEYLFEGNNIGQSDSQIAIGLTPFADLVPSGVSAPSMGIANLPLAITWTVTNAGPGTAGDGTPGGTVEAWTDRIVLSSNAMYGDADDRLVAEVPRTGALDAGSSYGGSFADPLPEGLSGTYFVFVFTDATDMVYEQDNTYSNLARSDGTVTIAPAAFADLTVSEVTAPASAVVGEPILVQWVAVNTDNVWGSTPASQWYDRVVLSQDELFGNDDDRVLGEFLHDGQVNRGETYTGSATIPVPSNLNGQYYLFVSLDSKNGVYEYSYEGNNLSAPFALEITGPDLVVESVVAPPSAQFGQAIEISWTVYNAGNEPASGAWSDRLWLSRDGVLDPGDTLLLTQGAGAAPLFSGSEYARAASVTLPLNASVAEGPYLAIVQTDWTGTQPESAETNNTRPSDPLQLTLPPLPDLVVSETIAPVEAISGQEIPVSWTLTNQGMDEASGTWTDYVFLSSDPIVGEDQLFGIFTFSGSIAPGQSVRRTQKIMLPMDLQGQGWVIVRTDGQNQVFEHANDFNNTSVDDQAIDIRLASIPNLQVSGVTPPATAFSGQETLVEWQVANTGTGATSAPFWYDAVYLSPDPTLDATDVFLGESTNASYLEVGESYPNSMTVRLPRGIDGNFFFLVKTDSSDQVFESDTEGDNVGASGSMRVELTPPPDLQVASVQAPSQAFSGQPMTLNWEVVNQGEGETFETGWYDLLYMSADEALDGSDRLLAQVYHAGVLKRGESYAASRVVTLPIGASGDFFFLVRADGFNHVYEHAFEGNNVGHDATPAQVNLTPPPDLVVEEVTAPETALASHALTISYRVTNFGSTATPKSSWTDSFYLSTDGALDPATDLLLGDRTHFGALDVDRSYTNTATLTLPNGLSGAFYAFVVTDAADAVFEVDSANNTAATANTISVESRPADLVLEAASAPSSGEAGGSIRVEWTVRNLGMGDTADDSWKDRVIASTDAVLDGSDDVVLLLIDRNGVLNAGDSYTRSERVSIPFKLAGQYQLFIVTDVNNTVYEGANEGNNASQALPITITRQTPDLQVTAVDAPDSAVAGTSVSVGWRVENLGSNQTNSNYWYDRVFLSQDPVINEVDRELGSVRRSNPLDPAGAYDVSTTFTIPADLSGGIYYLVVRTDSTDLVLEGPLEGNNNRASAAPITVAPGACLIPDLAVVGVDAPTEGISGRAFCLTWTVSNDGDSTGVHTWYDAVYLSRDQIFDPESDLYLGYRYHDGGLLAGESYGASQAFTVPNGLSGSFYAFVAADRGNHVGGEGSEFNNAGYDGTSMLITLAPPADLVVGEITIPANAMAGCEATIDYSVWNEGDNAAFGTWFDSIYISADERWDLDDPLFGRVQHNGGVAANASYSERVTAPLPGITPGEYCVIIRSDILNHVRESNEGNNIGASLDQVSIDAQELALGTPTTGTLGENQSVYYRVDVEAGETLMVSLDSGAANASNELYLRYGEMPTRAEFDFAFPVPFAPDQEVVVPATRGGTYYILAYGSSVPGAPASYSMEADLLQFSIRSVSPDHGSNVGEVTVTVEGVKFSADGVASLVAPDGSEREASRVWWVDSSTIWATFDLRGLMEGAYDVEIHDDGLTAVAQDAFTVNSGAPGDVDVNVIIPSALRPGQLVTAIIEYANAGETDVLAPILFVSSENALLRFPGETGFTESAVQLLGINQEGPAGILPPGVGGSLSLVFKPMISGGTVSTSIAAVSESDIPIDWLALKDDVRPTYIPADTWDAIWTNFTASVGLTGGDLVAVLSDNATRLSQLGNYTNDIGELLAFELQQADDVLPGATLANGLDVVAPAPGLPLTLFRTYPASLSDRFRLGPLGRGWTHGWEISTMTDSEGNIQVQMANSLRYFKRQADGSYVGGPGESAALSLDSGAYRLREADGTLFMFLSDGNLNYIEDPNGNRITVLYTDGRLTSLVHSNGGRITLSYNAWGRISQIVDPTGDITTYSYDESGEHLLAVTDSWGTTEYTYDLGQGTAAEHALLSVGYPGGTHQYFEYDDRGRLLTEQRDGGAERISYSYDSAAGISITDAAGATTILLLNNLGQIGQLQDALGRSTRFLCDETGNLVLVAVPGDLAYSYEYDDQGNVTTEVDPLGNSIGFTYDPTFNRLISVSDERGNVTRYAYDDKGNPTRITYPDGSSQQASYDELGNIDETVNGRGHPIQYTYDDRGLVIRKDSVDGSPADFTYDDHGNMLTATDASGTTAMEYDSRQLLTRITYPSGRFISYTYDDGGHRIQMSDQDGFTVNYLYDAAGRLERLVDGQGATVASYTYDSVGRLVLKRQGNGTHTTYEYDAAGQLLHLVNYAPDGLINSRFDYTYDDLGRCTSMTTLNDGNWTYTYDAIGQLTHAAFDSIGAGIPDQELTYVYDAAGNRIRTIENGMTTEYTTNNMNQYTMVGGATYEYDADGDLIAKVDGTDIWTYNYDDENQLTQVATPQGSWTYQYNAFGDRIAALSGGQRIEYLLDPAGLGSVIGEYDGSGSVVGNYIYGVGLTGHKDATGEMFYYDFDAIGSTIGLSGSEGSYLNQYSYLPFGEPFGSNETAVSPFGYVGKWGVVTEENDLHFMRARYYDSATGRFLSMDPIGLLGGDTNLYSHVGNDPVNCIDPAGLFVISLKYSDSPYGSVTMVWNGWLPSIHKTSTRGDRGEEILSGIYRYKYGTHPMYPTGGKVPYPALNLFTLSGSRNLPGTKNGKVTTISGVNLHKGSLTGCKKTGSSGCHVIPRDRWNDFINNFEKGDEGIYLYVSTQIIQPKDPNDIVGPGGFGDEHWMTASQTLPYTIRFENAVDATAPAQQVVITQELDPDLDPRTFRVDDFGWGDLHFELPGNQSFYNQRLDLRQNFGFFVDVSATVDVQTGLATWTLTTIDPAAGEQPLDARVGFLPPEDGTGCGEGFVSYSVRPRRTVATGAVIDAQARIIFDTEEPIDTPPIFNTIDAVAPTSAVCALPDSTEATRFLVSWSGTDDEGGSAVRDFSIYVSDNGSMFVPWLFRTQQIEATFSGQIGHSYAFYSVARDNAGNVEPAPGTPDAVIAILGSGQIEGMNFEDVDGDGVRDEGEPGLAGWTVYLDQNENGVFDGEELCTTADAKGYYAFPNLPPATYVVAEEEQAGWVQTAPAGETYEVILSGGETMAGLDFANQSINDPPVNTVPGTQKMDEDTVLVFSDTFQNTVRIFDPDAGSNPVEVILAATNGVMSLSGSVGLVFAMGDGAADGAMNFTGTLEAINAALDGLQFEPLANFNGEARLELTTNDLGNTGAGGPQTDTDSIEITVVPVNDAPAVDVMADVQMLNEGCVLSLTANVIDPDDTVETLAFTWDFGDGTRATTPTANHIYADNGTYTVSLRVADDDSAVDTDAVEITVMNVAAELRNLAVTSSIKENDLATLSGDIVDPGTRDSFTLMVDWGDGSPLQTFSYCAGTVAFSETHRYLDDDSGGTGSHMYAISATVADDDSGSDAATALVAVNNIGPVITNLLSTAPDVGDAAEGELVTVTATFTDIGTLDTHTAIIDWGDGTTWEAVVTEKDGAGLLSGSHKYIHGGIYQVKVSLSDDDNASTTQGTKALITGAGVKDGVLYIVGTAGDDHISVNQERKGVKVHADFLPDSCHFRTFRKADIQRIKIYLGEGNDHATVAGNVDLPALMDGGAGNDYLCAGGGPAVLLGGDGNDVLFGGGRNDTIDAGAGDDWVFGGSGNDTIAGGDGNDIIFGGSGSDQLNGDSGNDRLYGGCGNDVLDGGNGKDWLFDGPGNDILIRGAGDDKLNLRRGVDFLIGDGSVGRGKAPREASEKFHSLIDWHGNYGDSLAAGHRVGGASRRSSPSWVRQFVVDLGAYGLDPNGDIRVMIPGSDSLRPLLVGGPTSRERVPWGSRSSYVVATDPWNDSKVDLEKGDERAYVSLGLW